MRHDGKKLIKIEIGRTTKNSHNKCIIRTTHRTGKRRRRREQQRRVRIREGTITIKTRGNNKKQIVRVRGKATNIIRQIIMMVI